MKIAYELEPVQRRALDRQANLLLLVALGASMVMMALAWAFARAMRNREELLLQLEKERHLASVGEMSAVLAHEIRNPLASLKGHAQLLLESSEPGSGAEKKSERVVSAAVRLEKLTAGLLEFVRSGSIQPSSVDPGAALRAAASDLHELAIEVDAPENLGDWALDEERMRQALVTLLQNAGQAGSGADLPIEAKVSIDSGDLVYEIRDHGVGLPGDSGDIYAPFVTTRTRGTGLGLAVTQSIVKAHGGEIVGANHPGGGAVFRIVIPPSRRTRS
jgi:two-component system sensor histidine kinase HydH